MTTCRAVLVPFLLAAGLAHFVAACTVRDPLYCDENTPCTDPGRPICDLNGEYPASEGVGRTCIPDPSADDGPGEDQDAGPDQMDAGSGDPDGSPSTEPVAKCPAGLAFVSQRDGNVEIYLSEADGSNPINLTQSPDVDDGSPAWSPDGTRIAFVRDSSIWSMNAAGGDVVQLTTDSRDSDPKWSPDGTRIAFLRRPAVGAPTIWVVDPAGRDPSQLTTTDGLLGDPWSPDGKKLTFSAESGASSDIFTIDRDGSAQTNLTNSAADDIAPIWSPNGQQILFASGAQSNYDVRVLYVDGRPPRNLTNLVESVQESVFTPNGSKIIFVVEADGGSESHLYSMDGDGSDQQQITFAAAHVEDPTVSPDGTRVAWSQSDPKTVRDVYVADPDGTDVVRVTTDSGDNPAWQPCR